MALENYSFSKPHLYLVRETADFLRTTLFFLPPWTSALCSVKYGVRLHSLVQKAHDL